MKTFYLRIHNSLFQILVFKLGHFSTRSTNYMMMRLIVVRTLILRSVTKLMFNHQPCINQYTNITYQCQNVP